jgi:hypothetical protein
MLSTGSPSVLSFPSSIISISIWYSRGDGQRQGLALHPRSQNKYQYSVFLLRKEFPDITTVALLAPVLHIFILPSN